MEKEIWKDIEGYNGLYEVSSLGRIKSLNYNKTGKERILKGRDNGRGYLFVSLYKDGKSKQYLIHRLVGEAFCENPHGYREINHKDECKSNNMAENLEWCSHSYNNIYNDKAKKVGEKNSRPVFGINKVTNHIVVFSSAKEASKHLGINPSNITQCCQGKRYKSVGNYIWQYANQKEELNEK